MSEGNLEVLEKAGIDTCDALSRMGGSHSLLGRLLGLFLQDTNLSELKEATGRNDAEAGLRAAHSLKGLSGNLSMTKLFDLTGRQCSLFRAGDAEGAFALTGEVEAEGARLAEAVKFFLGQA